MATRSTDAAPAASPPAPSPSLPIGRVAWSASDPVPDLHPDEEDSDDAQRIESRFHLPPHHLASDTALYEGDAPNVLADNVLLHPPARPSIGSRASSWRSALFDDPPQQDSSSPHEGARSSDSKNRRRRTRPHRREDGNDDDHHDGDNGDRQQQQQQGESEEEEDHRDEHARNKSRYRKMPWHKRPSPIWFIPGTLVFALTMGMTIAPKLEIYTQLICRALPVDESGVTVPPPMIELGGGGGIVGTSPVWNKHPLNTNETTDGSASSSTSAILLEWTDHDSTESSKATGASNSPISDGEWAKQCHKSRAVQSQVAQLALLLSLLMGILSSLTTGFWGAFSDRRGRKPVLILALCGSLAMDVVFLLTVYYHSTLSYNFLLLGPILDGLVGGYSTAQATTAAYVSDTTSPGSRAKIFSAIGGLMYGGFAIGPVLGSFLITHSSSSRLGGGGILAPFYAALAMHAAYLLFLAVLLPESLSRERQQAARERHEAERAERRRLDREEEEEEAAAAHHGARSRWWRKVLRTAARPLAFLKPVALLLPQKPRSGAGVAAATTTSGSANTGTTPTLPIDPEERTNIEWGAHLSEYWNPEEVWKLPDPNKTMPRGGGGGADWTLTKIAAAWACYMCIMAVMSVKLMYANYTFGWGAAEDGYYLSFLGVLRVVMLVGLIPLLIKLVRRKPAPIPLRPRPGGHDSSSKEATAWDHEKRWLRVVHDSHFDLALARWSLLLDLFGFALFLLAPYLLPASMRGSSHHIALFLTAAVLQSMGSGASPAIQSLALAHASPRDAGRLFASLSVVQSIASQVVGPILFSVLFMQTVGRWSEAVFALASVLAAVAVGTLSLVKLRTVFVPGSAYRDYDHDHDTGGGGEGGPDLESTGAGRLGRGSEYEFDTSATPNLRFDKSSTTTTTTPAMRATATEDLLDVDAADAVDSSSQSQSQSLRGR